MLIRDYRHQDYNQVEDCYRAGFSQGHNDYTLARLSRWHQDTILVAEHKSRIVGVVIGVTNYREAMLTGLSVLPDVSLDFQRCSMRLLAALGHRLSAIGFTYALATTARKSVIDLAVLTRAQLVDKDDDYYHDGQPRWVYKADVTALQRLIGLLPPEQRP